MLNMKSKKKRLSLLSIVVQINVKRYYDKHLCDKKLELDYA